MNKKGLLVIFDHQLAYRSYKETNILATLEREFSANIFLLGSNFENFTPSLDTGIKLIHLKPFESFFLAFYANAYWNKVAKNSLSIQNTTRYRIKTESKISIAKALGKWYYKCFRRTPIILTQIFLYRVLNIIGSNISTPLKPKVLYVTVGGTNSISDLLVKKFSKHTEISTIIENWDNMSSKAVFDYPPLRIGVWGDQSIKFGRKIHKIDSNKMISLGNPRVEWLIKHFKFNQSGKNIFFGGGSVDLNKEVLYLEAAAQKAEFLGLKVYYLPHPKFYELVYSKLLHTVSENLIIIRGYGGKNAESKSLPKLTDYIPLFQEAKVFISSLSTMNLEASLLRIPSVAIDLKTTIPVSKNLISDRHDHIKDIKNEGLFHFVQDVDTFNEILGDLLESKAPLITTRKQISTLNYLINTDGNFMEKLLKFLK
jgi:hypothetical protein